jgi:hypothetical protein
MPVPWLRLLDAAIGATQLARRVTRQPSAVEDPDFARPGGPLEARLAGVVVAALREAFDRDHQRLELEREHLEAERRRAERALQMELVRQAAEQEIGRLRLLAGVAIASWLATMFFAADLLGGAPGVRLAMGGGWLLLLVSLAAVLAGHARVNRQMAARARGVDSSVVPADSELTVSSGRAGALASWLVVAGLGLIGLGLLLGA